MCVKKSWNLLGWIKVTRCGIKVPVTPAHVFRVMKWGKEEEWSLPWLTAEILFFYIIKCSSSPVKGLGGGEDHIILQHFLSVSFILFSPFHNHHNLTSSLYSSPTGVDFPLGSFTWHTDQTVKYSHLHSHIYTDHNTKPEL